MGLTGAEDGFLGFSHADTILSGPSPDGDGVATGEH